jgi:hypothetical protein
MKKLIFGLIAVVFICSSSYGQRKINKKKAGFMAVCDVIAGTAAVGLGPYGILWGGFIGSCAGAVLWEDMFNRNSNSQSLTEPIVKNNSNPFFDEYALIGKLHNDLMIKYCNKDIRDKLFLKNRVSEYLKREMLESTYFDQSNDKKQEFIKDLTIFEKVFDLMSNKDSTSNIISELYLINNFNPEEQDFYKKIINFNNEKQLTSEETFLLVDEIENSVKSSSELKEDSKVKLYYSLEILRYSYALWYENIQE